MTGHNRWCSLNSECQRNVIEERRSTTIAEGSLDARCQSKSRKMLHSCTEKHIWKACRGKWLWNVS